MRIIVAAALVALSTAACVSVDVNETTEWSDMTPGDFGEATLKNAAGATIGRAITTQGPRGLLIRVEADPARLRDDKAVPVSVLRDSEKAHAFTATAEIKTDLELQQLAFGGVVPLILARTPRGGAPDVACSH